MGVGSMIFETVDKRVVVDIMELVKKSNKGGIDLREVELFIRSNLGNRDTKLWIAFNGDKITGFLLAYIVSPMVTPEVFIAWAYVDPKESKVGKQFHHLVEKWATSLHITKISTYVRENVEAYQRKYGFKLDYYGVSKDLKPVGGKDVRNV
jgi:hypothetical protein